MEHGISAKERVVAAVRMVVVVNFFEFIWFLESGALFRFRRFGWFFQQKHPNVHAPFERESPHGT
jgi:hypothetical protein